MHKNVIDPELQLEPRQRAILAATVATEGFDVIKQIMEAECAKFTVSLLNTPVAESKQIVERHRLAKSAAMFYQGVMDRIKIEIELYTHAVRPTDKPKDSTEGLLNIDYTSDGGEFEQY